VSFTSGVGPGRRLTRLPYSRCVLRGIWGYCAGSARGRVRKGSAGRRISPETGWVPTPRGARPGRAWPRLSERGARSSAGGAGSRSSGCSGLLAPGLSVRELADRRAEGIETVTPHHGDADLSGSAADSAWDSTSTSLRCRGTTDVARPAERRRRAGLERRLAVGRMRLEVARAGSRRALAPARPARRHTRSCTWRA
jgi:hypothetical protein